MLAGSRWLLKEEIEEHLVENVSDQDVRTDTLTESYIKCVIQAENTRGCCWQTKWFLLFCVVRAVDPDDGEVVVYALLLSGGGVRAEVSQTAGGSVQ